jgi:hypothetical protein
MGELGRLAAADVLEIVDAGGERDAAQRGLLLLERARPDHPAERLAGATLGFRDAQLLALRCGTFGDPLAGRVRCPACELLLAVDVGRAELERLAAGGEPEPGDAFEIECGDVVVTARPPDGHALRAAAAQEDVDGARRSLIGSCVLEARSGKRKLDVGSLSDEVLEQVGEAIVAADPQSEVRIELTCAGCGHEWMPVLDIALFFWRELSAASVQILDDVHQLATGYGWSEEEVLRLSSRRRRRYVERLASA